MAVTSRPRGPVEVLLPQTYARAVPYALFAQLRRAAPVCWIDEPAVGPWPAGPGYWAVFTHAEVKHVLRRPEVYSSHAGCTQIRDPDTATDLEFGQAMMVNQDAPAHSRLRRIMADAFTPRAVRALELTIEARAEELIAAVAGAGEADFAELVAELPVWTLAQIMGVPDRDRKLLHDWASRVIGYQDADYAGLSTAAAETLSPMGQAALGARPVTMTGAGGRPLSPRSRAGLADMFGYANALAAQRPTGIVARMLDGGLTGAEFETMFFLFAVAGNETLRNGIPGGLACLLEHPDQFEVLRARPDLVNPAVEEMLRFWSPVIHFRRTALRDNTLAGLEIRAGEKVVVYHASANRDEAAFADPDRFDVARSPNDHVSFGFGPHFCLGAHLARTQMRAILRQVLARFHDVRPAGPPFRLTSNFQNGLKHLPIRWRPAG
ncbi:MAG: cytochrome P450 [Acidimicrobiia bacterium]